MIKANELRLGNWVTLIVTPKQRHYGKITAIEEHRFSITCSKMIYDFYEDLEGINITPEMLEKAGFINDVDGVFYIEGKFELFPYTNTSFSFCYNIEDNERVLEVKYIHQLQNLYFSLTGEELEITL